MVGDLSPMPSQGTLLCCERLQGRQKDSNAQNVLKQQEAFSVQNVAKMVGDPVPMACQGTVLSSEGITRR